MERNEGEEVVRRIERKEGERQRGGEEEERGSDEESREGEK